MSSKFQLPLTTSLPVWGSMVVVSFQNGFFSASPALAPASNMGFSALVDGKSPRKAIEGLIQFFPRSSAFSYQGFSKLGNPSLTGNRQLASLTAFKPSALVWVGVLPPNGPVLL